MGLDSAEELSGYDDVDADQVFDGGRIGGGGGVGIPAEGRRRGKKPLSGSPRRSRGRRPMGRGFSLKLRGFEDTAKAVFSVTLGALALGALVLYATFGAHLLSDFAGALLASIVAVALLFYTASKMSGR